MFKTDQPISSFDEDILGRASFSKSLGKAILSYKNINSIAIGLFGAWGSGKTSIINMAEEHIESEAREKPNNEKPIIIRFNPWNYSDQNQLISQFFKQLSTALQRPDYSTDAKKAGEKLETYAKFFEPFTIVPTVGSIAKIVSDLLKTTGSAAKAYGDNKSQDLNSIRVELNELLAQQTHKIIVIIDDIDRLNNTEIRQVFQLVKSLGDFSNTIYLLAFEKNVVIKALKEVQAGSGEEYLEKVIQIPFEIPVISKQEVEQLLCNQLNEIIEDIPSNELDDTYWRNVYHSGLKYFFRNIRNINRYINSVRFGFELVRGEVNTVDFLAITGIQIFIPEVFYGIRENKDIFTGILDMNEHDHIDSKAQEQAKKYCDEIISRTNQIPEEVLKEFLKILFPKLETIYDNEVCEYNSLTRWRIDRRVCSPDVFDMFFNFSIPRGEISQKEIEIILSMGNNPESFTKALSKLNEDGKIFRFFERLENYTMRDIPEGNIEPIITVLMNIGDIFPERDPDFFVTHSSMEIFRLFSQLIQRFDNHESRFITLKNAIEKADTSIYTIVHTVSTLEDQHRKFHAKIESAKLQEDLTINEEQLTKLEKIACDKIQNWARDGRLKSHRDLISILDRWKEWGNKNQVDAFITKNGPIDFMDF